MAEWIKLEEIKPPEYERVIVSVAGVFVGEAFCNEAGIFYRPGATTQMEVQPDFWMWMPEPMEVTE